MSVAFELVHVLGVASAVSASVAAFISARSLKKEQKARGRLLKTLTEHEDLLKLFSEAAADGRFSEEERKLVASNLERYLASDYSISQLKGDNASKKIFSVAVQYPTERFYKALASEVGVLGKERRERV